MPRRRHGAVFGGSYQAWRRSPSRTLNAYRASYSSKNHGRYLGGLGEVIRRGINNRRSYNSRELNRTVNRRISRAERHIGDLKALRSKS